MNKMKKLIAFLLAACTIVGTLTSLMMVSGGITVHADGEEETEGEEGTDGTEETVTVQDAWYYFHQQYGNDDEKLHAMGKPYIQTGNENEGLALYALAKTGEVAIKNKKTGQVMFSNPRDVYLYSKVKEADKEKEDNTFKDLASQLFVEFETIETGEVKVLKSYEEAAMNNQITVSAIKNGVSVEYTLGAGTNRRLIPMRIEKSRYEEKILNLITDENAYMRMSKDGGIYSLKDPFDPSLHQAAIDNMKQQYPVIEKKNMAIYVCDEKISNYEKNLIEGWIRSYAPMYTFEELEADHELTEYEGSNAILPVFKMALEYKLTDDGFTVRLPASSITFNEDYFRLKSVTILPYMGAGSSEYEGYTLVPDGSGTIIRFEDTLGKNEYSFGSELYGPDNSYHTFSASYTGKLEVWRYPVFGMVEDFYRYILNGTEDQQYCAHANGVKVEKAKDYVALKLDPKLTGADKTAATKKLEEEHAAAYAASLPSCKDNKDGYELMYCASCDNFYAGAAIKATHPATSLTKIPVLKRAATCSSVSVEAQLCQDCGDLQYIYGEALDPNAHRYGAADEYGHKNCSLCGVHYAPTTIKRGEEGKDVYTLDSTTRKNPTCLVGGSYTYKYTPPALKDENGADMKDEQGNILREEYDPAQYPDIVIEVEPTGHAPELGKASAPSCSGGHQEISCKNCSTIFQMVNFDLDLGEIFDGANKIEYTTDNAKNCQAPFCKEVTVEENGESVKVIQPVDGHLSLTVDGKVQYVVLKGVHKYVLITELQYDAAVGVKQIYKLACADCGHINETADIPDLPVDAEGNVTVPTDYKASVTYEREESMLNDKLPADADVKATIVDAYYLMKINETVVIAKTPRHRYTEVKQFTVNADCAKGITSVKVERCVGCGHIKVTTGDHHEWDSNTKVVIYPATEYTMGMQRITCKACQTDKYEEIPALVRVDSVLLPVITLEGIVNEQVTGQIIVTDFADFAGRESELVYKSANSNIVKVEAGGKLIAVANGTTRVDVSLLDENGNEIYKANCNVVVKFKEDTTGVKKPVQPEGTYKKEDPRGFVGIITEGESLCTVTSKHGGKLHKYNSIALTVTPRPSDTYELTGALTATGNEAKFTVVSDRKYTGSYRVQYYMLSNQESSAFEASYAGMAKAYRKYLEKDTAQIAPLAESNTLPLYLETLGSVTVPDTFLSVPITKDAALTSFSNLTTINKELNEAGIKNIHYRLTGYVNGGMNPTMPYDISYQEVLGGNSGYKKFVEYANENGANVYTDYDFVYMHNDEWFDGYTDSDHAVKAIDNRYIVKKTYNPTYQSFTSTGLLAVSPSVYDYFYDHFQKQDAKLGSTGISVSTLGTDLNSDFDKKDPYNREDTKLFTQQVLEKMEKDYNGNVMTDGGNSYVLPYAKHVLNMSLLGSERMATSASVPFFAMVLHGAVNYAGKPTNMASSLDDEVLRIIENGASPYFVLAYQNQSALKENAKLSKYYAVSYAHWKNDIIEVYNELNKVLGGLQNASYNSHDYINAERIPGMVEYETERDEILTAVTKLYEDLRATNKALSAAEELVMRYVAYFVQIDDNGNIVVDEEGNFVPTTEAANVEAAAKVVAALCEEVAPYKNAYVDASEKLREYYGYTARAEELPGLIEEAGKKVNEFKGTFVGGKPTEEQMTKYNELIAARDALQEELNGIPAKLEELGSLENLQSKVDETKAVYDEKNVEYSEKLAEFNKNASDLANKATALNRYKQNVVMKKEALNVIRTDLAKKLAEIAELFGVDDGAVQKLLGDAKASLATLTDVESFEKVATLFTKEKYVGYGSFDKDGKYTPRAKDFIGADGEYVETRYTMSDNSVARCGWDKNGDGKNDVVILINYNTFDVCVYEDGKPVVIPAMSYEVLERK